MTMERSWLWRRSMVYIIVVACIGMLYCALYIGGNDLVVQAIVQASYLTIITVAGAYLGVSAWDDKNKGKEIIAQSAVDQATPSTSETSVEVSSLFPPSGKLAAIGVCFTDPKNEIYADYIDIISKLMAVIVVREPNAELYLEKLVLDANALI